MDPFKFDWLVGQTITHVSSSAPGVWLFTLTNGAISVECPWRLLENGIIDVSSDDHDQRFDLPAPVDAAESATSFLKGVPIHKIEVRQGTADIFIDFADRKRLEIVTFSSGYESWEIKDPFGNNIVAQANGQLSAWKE